MFAIVALISCFDSFRSGPLHCCLLLFARFFRVLICLFLHVFAHFLYYFYSFFPLEVHVACFSVEFLVHL